MKRNGSDSNTGARQIGSQHPCVGAVVEAEGFSMTGVIPSVTSLGSALAAALCLP